MREADRRALNLLTEFEFICVPIYVVDALQVFRKSKSIFSIAWLMKLLYSSCRKYKMLHLKETDMKISKNLPVDQNGSSRLFWEYFWLLIVVWTTYSARLTERKVSQLAHRRRLVHLYLLWVEGFEWIQRDFYDPILWRVYGWLNIKIDFLTHR